MPWSLSEATAAHSGPSDSFCMCQASSTRACWSICRRVISSCTSQPPPSPVGGAAPPRAPLLRDEVGRLPAGHPVAGAPPAFPRGALALHLLHEAVDRELAQVVAG